MHRIYGFALLACCVQLLSTAPASAQQTCKPALKFTQVDYAGMRLPKRQRTWTATLSVDARSCLTSSGRFEIIYSVEREYGLDCEVREEYFWKLGSVKVSREFWIDEAVGAYRIGAIAPCPCR